METKENRQRPKCVAKLCSAIKLMSIVGDLLSQKIDSSWVSILDGYANSDQLKSELVSPKTLNPVAEPSFLPEMQPKLEEVSYDEASIPHQQSQSFSLTKMIPALGGLIALGLIGFSKTK